MDLLTLIFIEFYSNPGLICISRHSEKDVLDVFGAFT